MRSIFVLGALLAYAAALYYRDLATAPQVAKVAVEKTFPKAVELPADDVDVEDAPPGVDGLDDDFGDDDFDEFNEMDNDDAPDEHRSNRVKAQRVSPVAHPTRSKVQSSAFNAIHQVHVRFCMA